MAEDAATHIHANGRFAHAFYRWSVRVLERRATDIEVLSVTVKHARKTTNVDGSRVSSAHERSALRHVPCSRIAAPLRPFNGMYPKQRRETYRPVLPSLVTAHARASWSLSRHCQPVTCIRSQQRWFLRLAELPLVEVGVQARLLQELLVCSALDDTAALQHQHLVGIADRRQAVGDHKRGPAA